MTPAAPTAGPATLDDENVTMEHYEGEKQQYGESRAPGCHEQLRSKSVLGEWSA